MAEAGGETSPIDTFNFGDFSVMSYAIEGITLVFVGYLAVGFVLGAIDRFFAPKVKIKAVKTIKVESKIDTIAILEEVKTLAQPVFDRSSARARQRLIEAIA